MAKKKKKEIPFSNALDSWNMSMVQFGIIIHLLDVYFQMFNSICAKICVEYSFLLTFSF